MDKYELEQKIKKLQKLVNAKDYHTAIIIVDEIDWRRVPSLHNLRMVAKVYEAVGRYEEAIEILELAYKQSPYSFILVDLVKNSLQNQDINKANIYFSMLEDIEPNSSEVYLLKYLIAKCNNENIYLQIGYLEQYLNLETNDKYMYELANLYHLTKDSNKAVSLCDKIFLMYGVGEYVDKALDLKVNKENVPLTQQQIQRLETRDEFITELEKLNSKDKFSKKYIYEDKYDLDEEEYEEDIFDKDDDEYLSDDEQNLHEDLYEDDINENDLIKKSEELYEEDFDDIEEDTDIEEEIQEDEEEISENIEELEKTAEIEENQEIKTDNDELDEIVSEEEINEVIESVEATKEVEKIIQEDDTQNIEEKTDAKITSSKELKDSNILLYSYEKYDLDSLKSFVLNYFSSTTTRKITRLSATDVNKKTIAKNLKSIKSKCVIIEEALKLSTENIESIFELNQKDVVFVLVDTKKNIDRFLCKEDMISPIAYRYDDFVCEKESKENLQENVLKAEVKKDIKNQEKDKSKEILNKEVKKEQKHSKKSKNNKKVNEEDTKINQKNIINRTNKKLEDEINDFIDKVLIIAKSRGCVIPKEDQIAIYEVAKHIKQKGGKLNEKNAEKLVEDSAERAFNVSFMKKVVGVFTFTKRFDKDRNLIIKEEHIIP